MGITDSKRQTQDQRERFALEDSSLRASRSDHSSGSLYFSSSILSLEKTGAGLVSRGETEVAGLPLNPADDVFNIIMPRHESGGSGSPFHDQPDEGQESEHASPSSRVTAGAGTGRVAPSQGDGDHPPPSAMGAA